MVRVPFFLRTYLITKNRKCLSELKPSEIDCKKIELPYRTQQQELQPGLGVIGLRNRGGVRDQGTTLPVFPSLFTWPLIISSCYVTASFPSCSEDYIPLPHLQKMLMEHLSQYNLPGPAFSDN